MPGEELFEEIQRRPLWERALTYFILVLFAIPALLMVTSREPWLILFAVFFVGVPVVATWVVNRIRLSTRVTNTEVTVAYGGKTEAMALSEIVRVGAIRAEDTPIPHGRAGRFESGGDVAVFIGKTDAVGIEDRHGHKLIIGTERPQELASVIEGVIGAS